MFSFFLFWIPEKAATAAWTKTNPTIYRGFQPGWQSPLNDLELDFTIYHALSSALPLNPLDGFQKKVIILWPTAWGLHDIPQIETTQFMA
jgi:hypothetical protein